LVCSEVNECCRWLCLCRESLPSVIGVRVDDVAEIKATSQIFANLFFSWVLAPKTPLKVIAILLFMLLLLSQKIFSSYQNSGGEINRGCKLPNGKPGFCCYPCQAWPKQINNKDFTWFGEAEDVVDAQLLNLPLIKIHAVSYHEKGLEPKPQTPVINIHQVP